MRNYARFEALLAEANAASGSPNSPGTVSAILGGYQLCGTDSNGNTTCDKFTGFRTDASGRITDLAVNGQLISPRLAAGASSTGSQLAISDVIAYRVVSIGEVVILDHRRSKQSGLTGDTDVMPESGITWGDLPVVKGSRGTRADRRKRGPQARAAHSGRP